MRRKPFLPPLRRPFTIKRRPPRLETLEDRTQPATLTLTLADPSVIEGGAATTGTLTRTGDLSRPLSVTLANSHPGDVSVPSTVVIQAGQASVTFPVTPIDDTVVDG